MDEVFKRFEKKYLISKSQKEHLLNYCSELIEPDKYYKYTICNIYFDTDNFDLIRTSLEKPIYKEKLRLRSYGIPKLNDNVFFEIKKKYKGIVGKRRIILKLKDLYKYLEYNIPPKCNKQIMNEINYILNYYKIKPKVFIAYDRESECGKKNKNLRITFDFNIRSREENLRLENGDYGMYLLNDNQYIMEIKTFEGLPVWFSRLLSNMKIYPISFSKYGNVYKERLKKGSSLNV